VGPVARPHPASLPNLALAVPRLRLQNLHPLLALLPQRLAVPAARLAPLSLAAVQVAQILFFPLLVAVPLLSPLLVAHLALNLVVVVHPQVVNRLVVHLALVAQKAHPHHQS
jgi:hypothetical protein